MKIVKLDTIDSTNLYAKKFEEDVIVIAREQTAGRGTKGRSFSSERGGLYLTKVVHELPFTAEQLFRIMTDAAVAVAETVKVYHLTPSIKWPNDVFVNGKKICGILIENSVSSHIITRSLVGIGLNVQNPLPEELAEIATTMKREGVSVSVEEVEETLLENLKRTYSMETYRGYLSLLGKQVKLILPNEVKIGIMVDVDECGRLLLNENGTITAYAAGEVSLRV